MISQKVNHYFKKPRKANMAIFQADHPGAKPVTCEQTGFIYHPANFPLEFKTLRFWEKQASPETDSGNIGVIFKSEKYIRPGTSLEVTIPLRNEIEKFRGKVVLIRNYEDYFEIGLWLCHREDASRVRIIEQICHIENYLKHKKYQDGPYSLNRDRVAEEWIVNNASSIPSL